MEEFRTDRRTVLRGVAGAGAAMALPSADAAAQTASETEPTTRATFTAVVDAVIPDTPEVADDLGAEHEPGGLDVGLDAYLIEYVNTLFSAGTAASTGENLRLAEAVAKVCDAAATELLARGENEEQPDPTRFEAGGPFASLAREDRLRALALLDEKELDSSDLSAAAAEADVSVPVFEGTAGLVPQLVVAFTQVIYYSEWQGYEDISAPPSERDFSETVDGETLQSWQQTDFPGVIDGAAALRGFWGTDDASLGEGEVWKSFENERGGGPPEPLPDDAVIDSPRNDDEASSDDGPTPKIYMQPGEFTDGDYDTSDYEEPFDTSGDPAGGFESAMDVQKPDDAVDEARGNLDDDLFEQVKERLFETGGDR
ncbi:MAG: hypothetical protein ACI8U4_000074 [Natronomonas sp.]|jgi:hypothetical protein